MRSTHREVQARPFTEGALHWSLDARTFFCTPVLPSSDLDLDLTKNMWVEYGDAQKLGELAREAAREWDEKSKKAVEQAKTKL